MLTTGELRVPFKLARQHLVQPRWQGNPRGRTSDRLDQLDGCVETLQLDWIQSLEGDAGDIARELGELTQ